jgi:hypothetical protein
MPPMMKYPEGMPCWAPGAADYLASILTGDEIAWEWGGGQSTAWLVDKVHHLCTMEHDPKWAWKIEDMVGEERTDFCLYLVPFESGEYIDLVEIAKPTPNLWLIDGYKRIDCLELVLRKRNYGDIVVLDDALDYAEHLLVVENDIHRFAMPHPHAGLPITSPKHKIWRNTVRTHAPATKETFVWRV